MMSVGPHSSAADDAEMLMTRCTVSVVVVVVVVVAVVGDCERTET